MVDSPENITIHTPATPASDLAPTSAPSRIPFPKPAEPINVKREIKAKVLTGESYIGFALDRLKSLFIIKFFRNLFSEAKPHALTINEAKHKILSDSQFARKFAIGLSLYLNKEEVRLFLIELAENYKNLTDAEKENLNQFISTYVKTADPDEIDYVNAPLEKLFTSLRQEDFQTRSDTIMDQFSYLLSTPTGNASLKTDLDKIRKGVHFNREDCLDVISKSLKNHAKFLVSQVRVSEIAEFSRNGENGKLPSLQLALEESNRLMDAIRNDIFQDSDQVGIKNSLEFYIELADKLSNQGDAHSLIVVLAVLLDPDMESVFSNVNISEKHRALLSHLEKRASSIDSAGLIPDRPEVPSLFILIDRSKDLVNRGDLRTVSDTVLSPLENAFNAIDLSAAAREKPFYNLREFIQQGSKPTDVKKNREALEADISQIYQVLKNADSEKKLRITPDGLITKERSIFSRFTERLAGKKEPAQKAVQHVLAKIDRALDQDPAQLEKIGHIINFLKSHPWSKIVLNKNDNLNAALNHLEQKYLSKIDKEKDAEALHNRTKNGLDMLSRELHKIASNPITTETPIVISKGLSGGYNFIYLTKNTSKKGSFSKNDLQNYYILLKDASNDPELKPVALELLKKLYDKAWFEEALDKHKKIGDDIIQLGREMSQKWMTVEEAGNVPQ